MHALTLRMQQAEARHPRNREQRIPRTQLLWPHLFSVVARECKAHYERMINQSFMGIGRIGAHVPMIDGIRNTLRIADPIHKFRNPYQ